MMNRVVTTILTLLFLGVMFGGVFQMSTGMGATGDMPDCLLMSGEETLCSMNVFDHIGVWQSTFLATVPTFVLLLTIVSILIIVAIAPNLLFRQKYRVLINLKTVFERVLTFSYRPLQDLFSNGILNPKLF